MMIPSVILDLDVELTKVRAAAKFRVFFLYPLPVLVTVVLTIASSQSLLKTTFFGLYSF